MTPPIEQIYHFEQITDQIGCSGQPSRDEFQLIADAGYEAVVNLALPSSDNALPDESSLVTALDMAYFQIPVKFESPTMDELQTFVGLMETLKPRRVFVHCAVNARVSAFLYLYLHHVVGLEEAAARTQLLDRWEPQMDDTWKAFITSGAELLQR